MPDWVLKVFIGIGAALALPVIIFFAVMIFSILFVLASGLAALPH